MYRKRNGSRGFSFTKFADIIVPNFFADTRPSSIDALLPLRRDMLHQHQLASRNVKCLDERSLYVAGVVENERVSKTCFKSLQKAEILSTEGIVDTTKIGPRFTHQVAILNQYRQRDLVNMLFWWEEECRRFDKLIEEDKELTQLIKEAEAYAIEDAEDTSRRESVDHLKFARERVRMKIRQRPSQRRDDTENDTDNIMDHVRSRAYSMPLQASGSFGVEDNDENYADAVPAVGSAKQRHQSVAVLDELPTYGAIAYK